MRLRLAAISRCRPRVLTVVVLPLVALLIVLANSSQELRDDLGEPTGVRVLSEHLAPMQVVCGWPLTWRRHILFRSVPTVAWHDVAWERNEGRLLGNAAIWLAILVVTASVSEWLVRRYRLRFCWSMRTLLVAIAAIAALCSWFTTALNRAAVHDPLMAEISASSGKAWLARWGPKWLDLVGADRLRRRIVGASGLWVTAEGDKVEELLRRLARLGTVRYLDFQIERLTPGVVQILDEMPELEMLVIWQDSKAAKQTEKEVTEGLFAAVGKMRSLECLVLIGPQVSSEGLAHLAELKELMSLHLGDCHLVDEGGAPSDSERCLAAIGDIHSLERLELERMQIAPDGLAALSGLTKLKSLVLYDLSNGGASSGNVDELHSIPPLFSQLPKLPQLELVKATYSAVDDRDLPYLAALPRLRSLSLIANSVSGGDFSELARSNALTELTVLAKDFSATGIASLQELKHLKSLHLAYHQPCKMNADAFDRAVQALRQCLPHVAIDDNAFYDLEMPSAPPEYDVFELSRRQLKYVPWLAPSRPSRISAEELAQVKW